MTRGRGAGRSSPVPDSTPWRRCLHALTIPGRRRPGRPTGRPPRSLPVPAAPARPSPAPAPAHESPAQPPLRVRRAPAPAGSGAGPAGSGPAGVNPSAAPPVPGAAASAGCRAARTLTIAWGDTILPGLRPGVKVYVSPAASSASTTRPSSPCPTRACCPVPSQPGRGRGGPRGPFRSTRAPPAGPGRGRPGARPEPPPPPEDPSEVDLDDLEDAPVAVLSPEQRLLEAFPGAEEVSP